MSEDRISFPCVKVHQPIGQFYVGTVAASDVLAIAYADIRRIEERDIERIVGIQRELNVRRVKQIKQYVTNIDAAFPTSIILAIDGTEVEYDKKTKTMSVARQPQSAKIIDGQHRIAGLEGFIGSFELVVTIFVDMELEDQAMTFATINLEQTKVSRSLAYDLYEFQKARSPQKTCHNIARLLNGEDHSPLRGRIKILGKATGEPFQFITQATFVSRLLEYISSNPMRDRDLLKRGKSIPPAEGGEIKKLILRPLFADERDADIARIVWNLFTAVARRWPTAWESGEPGDMLNRTQGFAAIMRFLGPLYRAWGKGGRLTEEAILPALKAIKLRDSDFTTERYPPGTSGEAALFRDFREQSGVE